MAKGARAYYEQFIQPNAARMGTGLVLSELDRGSNEVEYEVSIVGAMKWNMRYRNRKSIVGGFGVL